MEDALRARQDLNGHGCAWGQVNRERIDNAMRDMSETRKWLQAILVGIIVQMLLFIFTTFWFIASRAIP